MDANDEALYTDIAHGVKYKWQHHTWDMQVLAILYIIQCILLDIHVIRHGSKLEQNDWLIWILLLTTFGFFMIEIK